MFSKVTQKQAKRKNNPNYIQVGAKLMPILTLTTNALPANKDLQSPSTSRGKKSNVKWCLFHKRARHGLEECIAFHVKTSDEKTKWISNNLQTVTGASLKNIKPRCVARKSRAESAGTVVIQPSFTKKDPGQLPGRTKWWGPDAQLFAVLAAVVRCAARYFLLMCSWKTVRLYLVHLCHHRWANQLLPD